MISIVIPLYNKQAHISNTLKSVFNQTFNDFEVLLINDGSNDNSLSIASSFMDSRLFIFDLQNKGVSAARNFGILKAKYKLIAFLDADDVWLPNHLINLYDLHHRFPDCGLYCTGYNVVYGKLAVKSRFYNIPRKAKFSGIIDDYFSYSRHNALASASSIMIPKLCLEQIGKFNEQLDSGEDTELWIRLALDYQVAFNSETSVLINAQAENRTTYLDLSTKKHVDFDLFETYAKNNPSLKLYLDLNRFSSVIHYKLEGEIELANSLISKMSIKNLNKVQRILINMPRPVLQILLKSRNWLRRRFINLRVFY